MIACRMSPPLEATNQILKHLPDVIASYSQNPSSVASYANVSTGTLLLLLRGPSNRPLQSDMASQ